MENNSFDTWVMAKYYIFCGLFEIIWAVAVLGFTLFMVQFFNSNLYLLLLGLLILRPYEAIWKRKKSNTDEKNNQK